MDLHSVAEKKKKKKLNQIEMIGLADSSAEIDLLKSLIKLYEYIYLRRYNE